MVPLGSSMADRVILYRAPTTVADVDAIGDWLESRIDASVTVRDRFLDVHRTDELAERFAEARVTSPYERSTGNAMLGTIRYEERALEAPEREGGVLYDGIQIQRALNSAVPGDERGLETLHVPILDRAIGTWGDHDGRWHKRVSVLGQPALVSVPGLYEAPQSPRRTTEKNSATRCCRATRRRGRSSRIGSTASFWSRTTLERPTR